MTPLFKYSVDLGPRQALASKEFFQSLIARIGVWVRTGLECDFALVADGVERSPVPDHTVVASLAVADPDRELFALTWTHPGDDNAVRYQCQIELARER